MVPYQFGVDIFSELKNIINEKYELVTLDVVVNELKKIAKGRGKDAVAANVALELVKDKKVKILKTDREHADRAIVDMADKNTLVGTNDIALKKKLKNVGVKTIYLKALKHLAID